MNHAKSERHCLQILTLLLAFAGAPSAQVITGGVKAEEPATPVAGATIKLVVRKDSTLSDTQGYFRLAISGLSSRNHRVESGLDAALTGNAISFFAPAQAAVRIEAFNLRGRSLGFRNFRPTVSGRQRVDLDGLLKGLRGLGWLRLQVDDRREGIRIVGPDIPASGHPMRILGKAAARSPEALDTLVVEAAGYYRVAYPLYSLESTGFGIHLWKNSIHGMAPAEVQAWKDHLTRPVQLVKLTHHSVAWPKDLLEGAVTLADGKEAANWESDPCKPGAYPVSLRFAYAWKGKEYRDTVSLSALEALQASFRHTRDSVAEYRARYHFSWEWPSKISVVPERDWMQLNLATLVGDRYALSHPDAFQSGVRYGIEGGLLKYGEFAPAAGSFSMLGPIGPRPGFHAEVTVARREDHDLRVRLEYQPPLQMSKDLVFTNAWPAGGRFTADQVLRLQASPRVPALDVPLEMTLPGLPGWSYPLLVPWDGTIMDWTFPFPVLDTVVFQLKGRETGVQVCPAILESPVLRVASDRADTAVRAYEPNDNSGTAALVPKGRWVQAAWHFRLPGADRDPDFYRFPAARGEKIRISLRNPNPEEIALYQDVDSSSSGFVCEPGGEFSVEYVIPLDGQYSISVTPLNQPAGRYSFRIETVP